MVADPYKAQARARRKSTALEARRSCRALRRKWRRCFWRWPLGHEFVNFGTETEPEYRCVSCDIPNR